MLLKAETRARSKGDGVHFEKKENKNNHDKNNKSNNDESNYENNNDKNEDNNNNNKKRQKQGTGIEDTLRKDAGAERLGANEKARPSLLAPQSLLSGIEGGR